MWPGGGSAGSAARERPRLHPCGGGVRPGVGPCRVRTARRPREGQDPPSHHGGTPDPGGVLPPLGVEAGTVLLGRLGLAPGPHVRGVLARRAGMDGLRPPAPRGRTGAGTDWLRNLSTGVDTGEGEAYSGVYREGQTNRELDKRKKPPRSVVRGSLLNPTSRKRRNPKSRARAGPPRTRRTGRGEGAGASPVQREQPARNKVRSG